MAASRFSTPMKAAGRRSAGAASPRTPRTPRTPTTAGSSTPGSGASAPSRRRSGTPRKPAKASVPPKGWASCPCPRGWAPVCALRVGGKGSPLRRARRGSDTKASSSSSKLKAPKKLVAMASYKTRTAPETRPIPLPRLGARVAFANRGSTSTKEHRMACENSFFLEAAAGDDHNNSVVLNTPALERRPIKFTTKGGKAYGHGKGNRYQRLQKAAEKGLLNG